MLYYYLDNKNKVFGPYDAEQINKKLMAGEIAFNTLIAKAGNNNWAPLTEVLCSNHESVIANENLQLDTGKKIIKFIGVFLLLVVLVGLVGKNEEKPSDAAAGRSVVKRSDTDEGIAGKWSCEVGRQHLVTGKINKYDVSIDVGGGGVWSANIGGSIEPGRYDLNNKSIFLTTNQGVFDGAILIDSPGELRFSLTKGSLVMVFYCNR